MTEKRIKTKVAAAKIRVSRVRTISNLFEGEFHRACFTDYKIMIGKTAKNGFFPVKISGRFHGFIERGADLYNVEAVGDIFCRGHEAGDCVDLLGDTDLVEADDVTVTRV